MAFGVLVLFLENIDIEAYFARSALRDDTNRQGKLITDCKLSVVSKREVHRPAPHATAQNRPDFAGSNANRGNPSQLFRRGLHADNPQANPYRCMR
jgi:hypothetical protein